MTSSLNQRACDKTLVLVRSILAIDKSTVASQTTAVSNIVWFFIVILSCQLMPVFGVYRNASGLAPPSDLVEYWHTTRKSLKLIESPTSLSSELSDSL